MSLDSSHTGAKRKRLLATFTALLIAALIAIGAFAKNGWFPSTDNLTGKKTGWFGRPLAGHTASIWTQPDPIPQLSKEHIYVGKSLLAIEDAGAHLTSPADLAVWRPATGTWWVMGGAAGSQPATQDWGISTDEPVPGDYDGDGKTDFSVFRRGTGVWYVIRSSDQVQDQLLAWGLANDKRVPADYDGDGKTDRAVWRPSDGIWYIVRSSDAATVYQAFGASADMPTPADYDGDGRADVGVFRPSEQKFYWINSSSGAASSVAFGHSGSLNVSADYDGDGKADHAVRSGANWIIRHSSNGQTVTVNWQQAADIAVHNDYDGDGKVDIAVWRPSNTPAGTLGHWFIRQSASGNSLRQVHWGTTGDIPVPAFYRR
jgi:hypothetical protein